jgi:CRISPR-associated endonuclease/helicase Cas3
MMTESEFGTAFGTLAGTPGHFPWQWKLYQRFVAGEIPPSCNLPTGLGKTSVIHVWLLALATNPKALPRRLVYVVNRRTVVDQTTTEVENLRERLPEVTTVWDALWELCATRPKEIDPKKDRPLAISTLRGQFADNREWSADPSRPAVICGTVDMIGSRLLFSGYGCGFKTRPLHAGFLGQDALLIHDEAHLEPAFQELLVAIEKEQQRCNDFRPLRVMELTATSRAGDAKPFGLTEEEQNPPDTIPDPPTLPVHTAWRRQKAKKALSLVQNVNDTKLAEEIAKLAIDCGKRHPGRAILVFVRKVDDVAKVIKKLPAGSFEQLTGTLRGLERDGLVKKPIFQRFLPPSNRDKDVTPQPGTVYLVCTSAGEVGVNISADHLVCDLSTFESMAQRFGRVNRFGECPDTEIHVIHPTKFADDPVDAAREKTLTLLRELNEDASPAALGKLDPKARQAAFAPTPTILPTSDILFDAWALTTINKPLVKQNLPGRPHVEPYLHGVATWQPPETHVAWREEVRLITGDLLAQNDPEELLDQYPLKPHELLRDNSGRVYDRLKKLKAPPETSVWIVSDDDTVEVTTLGELIEAGKERIERETVLLPPSAGGLANGFLTSDSPDANDVSGGEHFRNERGEQRRARLWDDDEPPDGMRRILTVDTRPDADEADEEATGRRYWHWFELRKGGDDEGIKNSKYPVSWQTHTDDVVRNTTPIVAKLVPEFARLFDLAARWHDLGKKRKLFQTVLGNAKYPDVVLAKSGKKGRRIAEKYRHEFGSLLDTAGQAEFKKLPPEQQDLVLHLIAAHHGRGRPHFPTDEAFDPDPKGRDVNAAARAVPQRFAKLQRKYGRWGLAYLESLLRAADYAASASPSQFETEGAK